MPETDLRARSAADYLRMLQHLLPQGQAWTRAPGAAADRGAAGFGG